MNLGDVIEWMSVMELDIKQKMGDIVTEVNYAKVRTMDGRRDDGGDAATDHQ